MTVSVMSVFFFALLTGFSPLEYSTSYFTNHNFTSLFNDTSLTRGSIKPSVNVNEIPLHPSIKKFVAHYAESNDEMFENLKQNKSYYLKTIDKIFIQSCIPVELKYLAVVESKLKSNARSGCNAVGFWQFMPVTAKKFGLKITENNDERQNIWKSSTAAAKYLNKLYSYFGDWLLVIAAYNSGPAPVFTAIKRSGSRDFWQLQYFLPKETRIHVKKFIATHYYFEGQGSLVTLGKAESEKYLKTLYEFDSKSELNNPADTLAQFQKINQVIAIVPEDKN